jgi:hypothetical protein
MIVEKLEKPVAVACAMCGSRYASYTPECDFTCDECTIARQIVDGLTDENNMPHPFVLIDGEVLRLAKE